MAVKLDPIVAARALAEINKGLNLGYEIKLELEKLEGCGAECQARRDIVQQNELILLAYKRAYFPDAQ